MSSVRERTSWPVVGLAVGAGIVVAFQIGKAPPALPALREELGLSLVGAGWAVSIFNLLGAIVGAMLGALVGRIGDRVVIACGLLLVAAAGALGGAAGSPAMLLASRFFEGVGFLAAAVAAPTLILRAAAKTDRGRAFALWGTYNPAGAALAMLAAPPALAAFGWRGFWFANAAIAAAFAAWLWLGTRRMPPPPRAPWSAPGLFRDIAATAAAPGPVLLALAFAAYTFQFLAVFSFLPIVLVEDAGLTAPIAATLTAIAVAVNMVGNLATGPLLARGVAPWATIAAAATTMGLTAFAVYAADLPLPLRYAAVLVFSAVGGLLPATVLGAAPLAAPATHLGPTASGLAVQGSNIGQLAGPPALAALATASGGWGASPYALAAAAAIAVASALALRQLTRRTDAPRLRNDPP